MSEEVENKDADTNGEENKEEEFMSEEFLGGLEDIFEHLYEDVPMHVAKMESRKEREESGLTVPSLTYGEILFQPYALMFKELYDSGLEKGVKLNKFVDIGSGSGRPVFAAALLHPFTKCVGIEILENLHNLAVGLKSHWDENVKSTITNEDTLSTEFEFIHGDALEMDWKDADVVFINSTCFDDELLSKFTTIIEDLRLGALVITTTKPLKSRVYQTVKQIPMQEAWGEATTFISRKFIEKEEDS